MGATPQDYNIAIFALTALLFLWSAGHIAMVCCSPDHERPPASSDGSSRVLDRRRRRLPERLAAALRRAFSPRRPGGLRGRPCRRGKHTANRGAGVAPAAASWAAATANTSSPQRPVTPPVRMQDLERAVARVEEGACADGEEKEEETDLARKNSPGDAEKQCRTDRAHSSLSRHLKLLWNIRVPFRAFQPERERAARAIL